MPENEHFSAEAMAKEDVLRYLLENKGRSTIKEAIKDIGEKDLVEKAVAELESEGLVKRENDIIELTNKGAEKAQRIYEHHRLAETLLERVLGKKISVHEAAHAIEHLDIDVRNLVKGLEAGRVSLLSELGPGSYARVLAIMVPRPSMLARLYGVGVLPGRRIRVVSKTKDLVIVEAGLGAHLAAIDSDIARRIIVIKE